MTLSDPRRHDMTPGLVLPPLSPPAAETPESAAPPAPLPEPATGRLPETPGTTLGPDPLTSAPEPTGAAPHDDHPAHDGDGFAAASEFLGGAGGPLDGPATILLGEVDDLAGQLADLAAAEGPVSRDSAATHDLIFLAGTGDPAQALAAIASLGPVSIQDLGAGLLRADFADDAAMRAALVAAHSDNRFVSAAPDAQPTPSAVSDDAYVTSGQTWGMLGRTGAQTNVYGSGAADAWAAGVTGSLTTVVGIIDTGMDYTAPDLYQNTWINQGEISASIKASLVDTDRDGIISFVDLNSTRNASFVRDGNGNGRIDGADLLSDARWEDGTDADGNGYRDDLIGWDFVDNDNDPYDTANASSHGTHVAGTIGGKGGNGVGVAGVNWNVSMMALRFMGANGGWDSDAIEAIQYYTWQARHTTGEDFVATSNSWGGGGYTSAMLQAISDGARAGVLFVAAAGNDAKNTDTSGNYPSNYSTLATLGWEAVISVAALTSTGGLASFSNWGRSTVDLAAPGANILSTLNATGYGAMSGTSMAAPHVTGALALLASARPDLSAAELRSLLLDTTAATASLAGKTVTGGRLDIKAMLDAAGVAQSGAPALTSVVMSDSELTRGETATVTFTFDKAVTGFDLADIDLSGAAGTLSGLSATSSTVWTATFTPTAGVVDSTNLIRVRDGGFTGANNGLAGTGGVTANFSVDTLPRVAAQLTAITLSDSALKKGDTCLVTFAFDKAVKGFDLADIDLTGAAGRLATPVSRDGGLTWTAAFTATANIEDASNVIRVRDGGFTGASDTTAGIGGASGNFTVDTLGPGTTLTLADPLVSGNETAQLAIRFSEQVRGLALDDFELTGASGTLSDLVKVDDLNWRATLTPKAGVTVAGATVSLKAGGVTDEAGNASLAARSNSYAVDTVVPTVAITLSDSRLTPGDRPTVTFSFSEAVTGFSLDDIDLGSASGGLSGLVQIGRAAWKASFTPSSDTDRLVNSIAVKAAAYTDLAGNLGVGGRSASYAVDTKVTAHDAPHLTAIRLSDSALRAGETATVVFAFNKVAKGFDLADIDLGTTAGRLSGPLTRDGGLTWSAVFTATANTEDATNTIQVKDGGFTDATGLARGVGGVSGNFSIDTKAPVATITLSDPELKSGETATVTVRFSEVVRGFALGDIDTRSAGGTVSNLVQVDDQTWRADFSPKAGVLLKSATLGVMAGAVTDLAGNTSLWARSQAFAVDTKTPAASSLVSALSWPGAGLDAIIFPTGGAATGPAELVLPLSGDLSSGQANPSITDPVALPLFEPDPGGLMLS